MVDHGSRGLTEQLRQLTVGRVILLEPGALEGQRRYPAVVVMDGAEFSQCVHLEHSSLGDQVNGRVLKAIGNGHLTERSEGVGIVGSQTLGGRPSIHKEALPALAGGGETMEQLEAGHRITIRIASMETRIGYMEARTLVEGTAQVGLAHETDEAGNRQRGVLLHRNAAQESQSIAAYVIQQVFAAGWILNPLGVVTPGEGCGGLPDPRHAGGTRTGAQAAVKRAQPLQGIDADCAVLPT